jgi:hypothetical protein
MELCNKTKFIVSYVISGGRKRRKSYAKSREKIPLESEAKGIKIKCKCNGKLVNVEFIG